MLCLTKIPIVSKQELETMERERFCPQHRPHQSMTKQYCGNINPDQMDVGKRLLMRNAGILRHWYWAFQWDTAARAARDACCNTDLQTWMHSATELTAKVELGERSFTAHTAKSHQIFKIYTVPTISWGQPPSATAIGNSSSQLWP